MPPFSVYNRGTAEALCGWPLQALALMMVEITQRFVLMEGEKGRRFHAYPGMKQGEIRPAGPNSLAYKDHVKMDASACVPLGIRL